MMKKRVFMMMLAGVLAFSMIGCGGGDADSEDPGNDEQIVDTEDGTEDGTEGEDPGKDAEEQPPQEDAAGPSQTSDQTSQPVSGQQAQKPAQQKPEQQKPTQTQTPTEPSDSGVGNSGAANAGSGSDTSAGNAATDISSMTLEDIITRSYGDLELPATESKEVDASDANMMEWYFGTTDITFKRAVASEALISSIAHSVVAIEAEDGADVEALASKIKDNANVRKWICVEPSQVGVAHRGNVILFAMSNSADAIIENFKAL